MLRHRLQHARQRLRVPQSNQKPRIPRRRHIVELAMLDAALVRRLAHPAQEQRGRFHFLIQSRTDRVMPIEKSQRGTGIFLVCKQRLPAPLLLVSLLLQLVLGFLFILPVPREVTLYRVSRVSGPENKSEKRERQKVADADSLHQAGLR